jgi:hypothetical protein
MTIVHTKAHLNPITPSVKQTQIKNPTTVSKLNTLEKSGPEISDKAKELNTGANPIIATDSVTESSIAMAKATTVAKDIAKIPIIPIVIPKDTKKIEEKLASKLESNPHLKSPPIKKPAVLFIEGFSAFGISNGDGIKDMSENFPGAKRFSWNEKDQIIEEIKKHSPDQPVVLVGHSFGGDSAVEIANELNTVKNGFRSIDLLISIDSVGFNHSIIPMNVKKNLNFFGEGIVPFLHGDPTVARNTNYTEVINELRSELHSRMDDSSEVQFKIFENIHETLNDKAHERELEKLIETSLAENNGNLPNLQQILNS